MTLPKLFVFSPMPPARNGIADYSATLLTRLADHYDCICVIADDAPQPSPSPRAKHLCLSEYRTISAAVVDERHLFQVGNNSGHAYMLPWIERVSGVITIHDATLAHAMDWTANEAGGSPAYFRLAEAAEGIHGRKTLETAVRHGLWFGGMGQELTFLAPVVSSARAVVVHSRLARLRVLASASWAKVYVIPHFSTANPKVLSADDHSVRSSIHLLCLGFVARAKRIDLVLGAVAALRTEGLDIRLTIAGEIRPEEFDVENEIRALGLQAHVDLIGYIPEDTIDELLAAADIVVNLRDPTSGETSGTLSRALAAGRCVIVSDVGTYSELPDDCVVKVRRSDMNVRGLAQRLWRVVTLPEERTEIGRRAHLYAEATATLDHVAERYRDVIEQAYAALSKELPPGIARLHFVPRGESARLERLAEESRALASSSQLWWRERMLPIARPGEDLLIIGGNAAVSRLAGEGFGWNSEACEGAAPAIDSKDGRWDGLLLLVDEMLPDSADNLRVLADLIDMLRPSAKVTVEVANPAGLPARLLRLLRHHGYLQVMECEGPQLPLVNIGVSDWSPSSWCATLAQLMPAPHRSNGGLA